MTAFPDLVVAMADYLEKTDGGAEFHWTLTGTNTGPDGTGHRVRISGNEEWTLDSDAAEYERQLQEGV